MANKFCCSYELLCHNKEKAFYSLLLLSCSFWATCRLEEPEQETVINGHLVDAKTGKSVAGAYIDYRVYYMKDNMGFGDNGVIRPDTSGKFTIRYVGDKILNPFNVTASGYLGKTGLGQSRVSFKYWQYRERFTGISLP